MKELNDKAKRDNVVMKILKVGELHHAVAATDKGSLSLRLKAGETGADYRFVLDAVPVGDKQNKELMALLSGVIK